MYDDKCTQAKLKFFSITCATVKHLTFTCTGNYTGHMINYVQIKNDSLSNSMNSTKT